MKLFLFKLIRNDSRSPTIFLIFGGRLLSTIHSKIQNPSPFKSGAILDAVYVVDNVSIHNFLSMFSNQTLFQAFFENSIHLEAEHLYLNF